MVYTEIKEKNKRKYYYRVKSIRKEKGVIKKRKYLGINLDTKTLKKKEKQADKILIPENSKIKRKIKKIKEKITPTLNKNKIKKAGIFGSYALGKEKKNSDIDILIEPPKKIGLGFIKIKFELEAALKKKVDLLSYNGIHPLLKKRILNEEVRIL